MVITRRCVDLALLPISGQSTHIMRRRRGYSTSIFNQQYRHGIWKSLILGVCFVGLSTSTLPFSSSAFQQSTQLQFKNDCQQFLLGISSLPSYAKSLSRWLQLGVVKHTEEASLLKNVNGEANKIDFRVNSAGLNNGRDVVADVTTTFKKNAQRHSGALTNDDGALGLYGLNQTNAIDDLIMLEKSTAREDLGPAKKILPDEDGGGDEDFESEPFMIDEDQANDLDKSVTKFSRKGSSRSGMEILSTTKLVAPASQSSSRIDQEDIDSSSQSSLTLDELSTPGKIALKILKSSSKRNILRAWSENVLQAGRTSHDAQQQSQGRIARDIRQVAVSVASNIDSAWQWRLFSEEGGGLTPVFELIGDASRVLSESIRLPIVISSDLEEAFASATAACRALRDLCALSPELAAIIAEGVLDASEEAMRDNIGFQEKVIPSLVRMLKYTLEEDHKRKEAAQLCRLYAIQLLLALAVASDSVVYTFRRSPGLVECVKKCSSYANIRSKQKGGFPFNMLSKRPIRADLKRVRSGTLEDKICGAANELLASIGHNLWVPRHSKQRGLRILSIDGGGTRGITAITTLIGLVDAMNGTEICDAFDIIAGTSTGAIIAFLVALRRETSRQARKRYDELISKIFVKSALSTPMLIFTTASYDESHFMEVMDGVLGDQSMLDSRADPTVPLVFAVATKMSSNPSGLCLFRNYNYGGGEVRDNFVVDPTKAREDLQLKQEFNSPYNKKARSVAVRKSNIAIRRTGEGSRHAGSFRVPQKVALRATTAAPTVFKPVMMGGEVYCDGGMMASNPAAIAIHEARILFPDVPIEMVVSCGTGEFLEEKNAPRIGWDGIIGQIVSSAVDAEQTHHVLEDVLGQGGTAQLGRSAVSQTKYFRFNPMLGQVGDFPLDGTDPTQLEQLSQITQEYLRQEEQRRKLKEINDIVRGQRRGWWRRKEETRGHEYLRACFDSRKWAVLPKPLFENVATVSR